MLNNSGQPEDRAQVGEEPALRGTGVNMVLIELVTVPCWAGIKPLFPYL